MTNNFWKFGWNQAKKNGRAYLDRHPVNSNKIIIYKLDATVEHKMLIC